VKAEHLNAFIKSALYVTQAVFRVEPKYGKMSALKQLESTHQINITGEIYGGIEGQIVYSMTTITADRLAAIMLGKSIISFDELAASALAELANMINSHAIRFMGDDATQLRLRTSLVSRGTQIPNAIKNKPTLVVPIEIPRIGKIELLICIHEKEKAVA